MKTTSITHAAGIFRTGTASAISLMFAMACVATPAQARQATDASATTDGLWQEIAVIAPRASSKAATQDGAAGADGIRPRKYRALTLDRNGMMSRAANAPHERSAGAQRNAMTITLPHPNGGFQRFALVESPIMEDGLAAKHPEIKTYAGRGIDDPNATLRMDITPLGLHASVRSPKGAWFIDPTSPTSDAVYASYNRGDLPNPHGVFSEGLVDQAQISLSRNIFHADDTVEIRGVGFVPGASVTVTVKNPETDFGATQTVVGTADENGILTVNVTADPTNNVGSYQISAKDGSTEALAVFAVVPSTEAITATSGTKLRTYRLALLTDNTYATYFGGSANVTAAKVSLMNRVNQVYEAETSIRMVLIAGNDALNLDTLAQVTGTNGPCGGSACFTAAQVSSCGSSTLSRNRIVVGLLAGAQNFDIGHIAVGVNGGGIASLGVVGGTSKAQGCTGVPTPVGDYYAVDYVAHEMGHQFSGNHTFNGTVSNCSTSNRNAGTSVEPGSGSSVMAYAGICGTDNSQAHSDPYWSQRSFDEITTYTSAAETNANEVDMGALTNFNTNGQQFQFSYKGNLSAPIVRGTNFTTAGVKAALEALTGGTVTASTLGDTAFTVTFNGSLVGLPVSDLTLVNFTGGATGYLGRITVGGPTTRNGVVSATNGHAPIVTTSGPYTIPVRTPFTLTGSAVHPDGDGMTFMWEQNDRGATGTTAGTGLITQPKLNGPLFRQFGVQAIVPTASSLQYISPGENMTTDNPSRTFPDMLQILAGNTNAATGACPTAAATPTIADIACFSEYLPTAAYVGTAGVNAAPASLNFRLTARDGHGGIGGNTTQLILAAGAGPFLVTSQPTASSLVGGSTQTITWAVANTSAAPVSEANVKISLSTDGGLSFPIVLAASTPNTGSKAVVLPNVVTTAARIKVEAITNVFFDVSKANFAITLPGDANGDGVVGCDDLSIVKASIGKRTGQAGFDVRADLNGDGVVDARDLLIVSQRVAAGTVCK